MRFPRSILLTVSVLALAFSPPLAGQPTPKAAEGPKEDFVTEKGFSSRVFEVRHRDPVDLAAVLRPLGSGYRGAAVHPNRDFKTITVRDFPENVAAIESALRRLDVPEPPRNDVELHLYVLVASSAEAPSGRYPEELAGAVAALKATLQYRSYALAATFLERVREGSRGIGGQGIAEIGETPGPKREKRVWQAEYSISQLTLDSSEKAPLVKLDGFRLVLVGAGRAEIKTDVTLRDGEKVVVGTSTVADSGLVVVLSARVLGAGR
jgi:type II/III secretion system protein